MSYLLLFSEIKPVNLEIVGDKASNLALCSQNYHVPSGFVITKLGYQYFIESTSVKDKINSLLSTLVGTNDRNIQKVANEIQKLIVETPFPKDLSSLIIENYLALSAEKKLSAQELLSEEDKTIGVAVRSSYNDKTDGKLSYLSLLNIKGENELLTAIKVVFASQYTANNIRLRKNLSMNPESMVAVIVQRMINNDKSIQIRTDGNDEIKMRSVFGLFEAFNENIILYDEYSVKKDTLNIDKININPQTIKYEIDEKSSKTIKTPLSQIGKLQKLNSTEIITASNLAMNVGSNKLIEIGIVKDVFFIIGVKDMPTDMHTLFSSKKEDAPKIEVYETTPIINDKKEEVDDEFLKDEAIIYDTIEPEIEKKQQPLKKIELTLDLKPKKEFTPLQDKIDEETPDYDEEEDIKEEFEKEDFKVYEEENLSEKTKKKAAIIKPKKHKEEDEEEEKTYYEAEESEIEKEDDEDKKNKDTEKAKDEEKESEKEFEDEEDKDEDKDERGKKDNKKIIDLKKKDDEEKDDSIFSSLKTY